MNSLSKNKILIYILLFIYLLFNISIKFTNFSNSFINLLNIFYLLIISILFYYLMNGFHISNKRKVKKKFFLIIIIYLLIYFLLGIIFGFNTNNNNFKISFFISTIIISIFQEYIRYKLIYISKNKYRFLLVTLFFILININLHSLVISGFQYFFVTIIPIIINNIILTYLAYNMGICTSISYQLLLVMSLFLPFGPKIDWLVNDFFYLIILILIMIFGDYLEILNDRRMRRRDLKKEIKSWLIIIPVLLFILFVMGVFKYQPIAIMSNSMYDYFAKGDIVIIEKVKNEEKKNIVVGDIIYYYHDNIYITHRVIDIEKDGSSYIFHTKGDNNDVVDNWLVSEDDVKGVIKMKIKYLGWPSVLISELFS